MTVTFPRLAGLVLVLSALATSGGLSAADRQVPDMPPPEQCTADGGAKDPHAGVTLTGSSAPKEPREWVGDPVDGEDLTEPDDVGTSIGTDLAPGFQRLTIEFDPIFAAPAGPTGQAANAPSPAWSLAVDFWTALRGPVVEAVAADPSLRTLIVSLGASQGEAFKLSIVNLGTKAVKLGGEGLVVEPLKAEAMKAAERQFAKFKRGVTNGRVNGYCLDEALLPPTAGMIFRVAPPQVQRQIGSMRDVLRASRTLRVQGLLHPDSNPETYSNFIKQWSIWTKRERWTESTFTTKVVEYGKKQMQTAGRAWTADAERAVRAAVPGRWRDVAAVLAQANQIAPPPRVR